MRGEIRYHISLAKRLWKNTHGQVSKTSVGFFFFPLVFGMVMLLAPAVWSKTIHVPGDSATIQAGIDGTVHGDTVLVADGLYIGAGNRNIDFLGKAIVVRSENGPEVTVIDCNWKGRGFYFHEGENLESKVEGFTITRGYVLFEGGAGIKCQDSSPAISNCHVINNTASCSDYGGGIYCRNSSPIIEECIISGNEVIIEVDFSTSMGGGLYCTGGIIRDGIISHNSAWCIGSWGRGQGGGIDCDSSMIINCIIYGNDALWGGGIHCHASQFVNCTILFNSGSWEEALVTSPSNFINCIIWDTTDGSIYGDATVTYSDIKGGWPGEGNIDEDPLFRDLDNDNYHLMATYCGDPYDSPCIDAGDPSILDDSLDCWHGLGTSRSDMGAYGGANAGWPTLVEGEKGQAESLPKDFVLLQNYPNPFNSGTRLRYNLPKPGFVRLYIYNVLGQQLKVLVEGHREAGAHSIVWDASGFPSGIYFARLEVGGYSKTIKMVLLK